MKKHFVPLILLLVCPILLVGCGGRYDYTAHISELRSDIFRAETDEFEIVLTCVSREYPYCADGIACPRSDLVEISLLSQKNEEYCVYFTTPTGEQGGEASFRNAYNDYFYSEGVTAFPEGSVSMRVTWGGESREIVATSVKTEETLSPAEALTKAIAAEEERIGRMTEDGSFLGEFHVRLLRRDRNYYYVGIVDREGETLSMLMDSVTGDVLARRDTRV